MVGGSTVLSLLPVIESAKNTQCLGVVVWQFHFVLLVLSTVTKSPRKRASVPIDYHSYNLLDNRI